MARDRHELWDFESRNLLSAYDDSRDALDVVRATVREYGADAARLWG